MGTGYYANDSHLVFSYYEFIVDNIRGSHGK